MGLQPFVIDPFLLQVLLGALLQACLSTFVTLIMGGLGCLGLIYILGRIPYSWHSTLLFLVLSPSFIPPLVLVTLSIKVFGSLLTGLTGVVFFHTLMNLGLASVIFYKLLSHKAYPWIRFAIVSGVSRKRFIIKALIPSLAQDLAWVIFYFFILYFFSFSIPFLVGGARYGGLEVFIYEQVVFFGNWVSAAHYGLLLFALLFVMSHFLYRKQEENDLATIEEKGALSFLSSPVSVAVTLAPLLFILLGLVLSVPQGLVATVDFEFYQALRGTLVLSLAVGLSVFCLLSLLTYSFQGFFLSRLLLSLVHPGWVIVGFAFLLMPGKGPLSDLLKMTLGLTILYVPFLYRLSFHQALQDLSGQKRVCEILPVSWNKTFMSILWPQLLPTICLLSGLAALWASGDFAITGLLLQSPQVSTLGYEMKSLLSNYHSEQAVNLMWPMLLSGGIVFVIFQGLGNVSRKKILS